MKTTTRQLLWLPIALLLLSLSQLQAEETVTVEISYGFDSGGTATIFDKTLNQQLVLTENKAQVIKGHQIVVNATGKEGRTFYSGQWWPTGKSERNPIKALPLELTADVNLSVSLTFQYLASYSIRGEAGGTLKGYFLYKSDPDAWFPDEVPFDSPKRFFLDGNDTFVFKAQPSEGYTLKAWYLNGELVQGESTLTYKVVHPRTSIDVEVEFSKEVAEAKVTMVQPDATQGSMTAHYTNDATKEVTDGASVAKDTQVTFVVTPKEGYEMASWKVDDQSKAIDEAKPNELTLTVTADLKVEPVLKTKVVKYTVTMTQPDATQGSMTAHYTNDATKAVTDGMSVEKDTQVTFVVAPKEGYEMASWKVNTETKPLESADPNQLTLTVTDNLTVQPVLKAKAPVNPTEGTITVKIEGTGGHIKATYKNPDSGNPATIWPDTPKKLPNGTEVTLTATIATAGYEVTYTNNGKPVPADALSADGTVYTFTVNGDATVVATFAQKQVTGEFTVTCVADPTDGGEVSASTAEGPITSETKVDGGTLITVNATAKENFAVDQWFFNGKELTDRKGKDSYTFVLTEDVTIKVTFKSTLPPAEYAVTVEPVLPSAEAGTVKLFYKDGSVVASGTKVVTGSEMYVEVKPADKYELETLQVGETKIPAGDEKLIKQADGGFKYAFTVTEATKIQATFKLINAIEQLTAGQVAVYVTNGGTRLEVAGAADGAEVRLYDYTGQLLLTSTEHALDISALPAGSYIVLVGNYTTRIVK
ncbi:T9SS type A sorting domain-containing protein [Porphyromonas sp.]|uniref:T9SS type A sorting domain-containing protein n=1 Tax=Porphyromonas sp. TaxID=1924944 RepID=UPI003AB6D701